MKNKLIPQANDLNKVFKILVYISQRPHISLGEIAKLCDFEERQASYYLNALFFLDMINKDYTLTDSGKLITSDSSISKKLFYKTVLTNDLINELFIYSLFNGDDLLKERIFNELKDMNSDYSEVVLRRRTSTLYNWIDCIKNYVFKINK